MAGGSVRLAGLLGGMPRRYPTANRVRLAVVTFGVVGALVAPVLTTASIGSVPAPTQVSLATPRAAFTNVPFSVVGRGLYVHNGSWVGLNDQLVTLQSARTLSGPWVWVAYLHTTNTGDFGATVHTAASVYYRAVVDPTASIEASTSSPQLVTLDPPAPTYVAVSASWSYLRAAANAVSVTGFGGYEHNGQEAPLNDQLVTIQSGRTSAGPWMWLAYVHTSAIGDYSVTLIATQNLYYRAVVDPTPWLAASTSEPLLVALAGSTVLQRAYSHDGGTFYLPAFTSSRPWGLYYAFDCTGSPPIPGAFDIEDTDPYNSNDINLSTGGLTGSGSKYVPNVGGHRLVVYSECNWEISAISTT
jgi:hypothetical protein